MKMKSSTIYSNKESVLCVVTETVPKEPMACSEQTKGHYNTYQQALQRCKDTAVPFENSATAGEHIGKSGECIELKPDTFYTVQEFEYEVIQSCNEPGCIVKDSVVHERVARLLPVKEQPESYEPTDQEKAFGAICYIQHKYGKHVRITKCAEHTKFYYVGELIDAGIISQGDTADECVEGLLTSSFAVIKAIQKELAELRKGDENQGQLARELIKTANVIGMDQVLKKFTITRKP